MNIMLICIFGIAGHQPVMKRHLLTPNQADHLANSRLYSRGVATETRPYESRICRAIFGSQPDHTYTYLTRIQMLDYNDWN